MVAAANSMAWWLVPIPGVIISAALFAMLWVATRKRRWRDRVMLSEAASMPPEHIEHEPKEARDLQTGESGWVSRHSVVTSKKDNRAFVAWAASLVDEPRDPNSEFAPLRIVRLKRGFSLAVRPGVEFRSSSLPLGYYAPVIEIVHAEPGVVDPGSRRPGR